MPSNRLILCRPRLLLPSIFPRIRVFSNESALRIRWPKYWSFSFNISPSNEHPGLIFFGMDWLDLLVVDRFLTTESPKRILAMIQNHTYSNPLSPIFSYSPTLYSLADPQVSLSLPLSHYLNPNITEVQELCCQSSSFVFGELGSERNSKSKDKIIYHG